MSSNTPRRNLERELWLHVIRTAQTEARSRRKDDLHIAHLAARWLTTGSREFMRVCDMAGLTKPQAAQLIEKEKQELAKLLQEREQEDEHESVPKDSP